MTTLRCRGLSVRVGDAELVAGVDLDVPARSWVTVVGPNGAGKTTLLRALAGLVPAVGTVELDGRPAASMRPRERARLVAVVPQTPLVPPGVRVSDYVLLGRTAHLAPLGRESAADLEVVTAVLDRLELGPLADRAMETLSGGERQRAVLARALAQQAPLLLLDEPTSSLDVGHQQEVLDLVDDLRATQGLTVLSTMHDLTLAGQYAEQLVLLDGGRVVAAGPVDDVLTEDNLTKYYRARVRIVRERGTVVVVPVRAVPR